MSKPDGRITVVSIEEKKGEAETMLNGFTFTNRLKIPVEFCIEGTSVDLMKQNIL